MNWVITLKCKENKKWVTPLEYLTHILNGVVISSPSACMYTLDTKGQRILFSHTHIWVSKNYLYERWVSLWNLITSPSLCTYIKVSFQLYIKYMPWIFDESRGVQWLNHMHQNLLKYENYKSLVCVRELQLPSVCVHTLVYGRA